MYQEMSLLTGGYRYPSCASDYTDMFKLMSQGVISSSKIPCEFELPSPPNGEALDLATIEMTFRPDGNAASSTPVTISQVPDATACNNAGFIVADGGITLCPTACEQVERSQGGTLETLFGCTLDIR